MPSRHNHNVERLYIAVTPGQKACHSKHAGMIPTDSLYHAVLIPRNISIGDTAKIQRLFFLYSEVETIEYIEYRLVTMKATQNCLLPAMTAKSAINGL